MSGLRRSLFQVNARGSAVARTAAIRYLPAQVLRAGFPHE